MRKRPYRPHRPRRTQRHIHEPTGELLEVEVERILPGGLGLAHLEGKTVLVALAAPGDRARVRVRQKKGRTLFASIEEILAPGRARVTPPCPYFGRCGGCDFQQLTYEAQLEAKVGIIRDCLRRFAHIEAPPEILITPSPYVWHYRSRAQWQYDPVRKHLGYFERGTHNVCDVVECPVVIDPLQKRLTELRVAMSEGALPDGASEFEAVAGDAGVALTPSLNAEHAREQRRTIAGEDYRFDAGCFFQINHALLEPLVLEALSGIDTASGLALDLYSGVGLFTLPLARRFKTVVAVEANTRACEYARRNLSDAGLTNTRVEESSVGAWMQKNASQLATVDLVLLDPPRAGAEAETINAIVALRPAHISYISCDPATLARDLAHLLAAGYSLASIRAFDLFPQTHHVETVVHLSKSSSVDA